MRILVTVLLLLTAVDARADSDLLAACKEKATRPGERALDCPGFSLSVSVEQPAFGEDAVLKAIFERLERQPDAQVDLATLVLGEGPRHGLRYTLFDATHKPELVGVVAMVPSSRADQVRMIGCEESKASKCERALTALAAQVKVAVASQPQPSSGAPMLAGRAVAIPAGCHFKIDGPKSFIGCANANISWVAMHVDDPADIDWIYNPIKSALATRGKLSEKSRPCTIDGVTTQCRVIDVARPDGGQLSTTCAAVTLRGQRVWLQCNVSAKSGPLPPPCDALIR